MTKDEENFLGELSNQKEKNVLEQFCEEKLPLGKRGRDRSFTIYYPNGNLDGDLGIFDSTLDKEKEKKESGNGKKYKN